MEVGGDKVINIDRNSPISINNQIVEQIKKLIFKEVLTKGDKLPSVRSLSSEILVNPNTIQKAYKELELLGFVETIAGKGVYVGEVSDKKGEKYKAKIIKKFKKDTKELIDFGLSKEDIKNIIDEV